MRKLFESLFKSYGVNEEYRPGKIKDVRIAVSVLDIFVTEETAVFNFCKLVFKFFGTHDKQYGGKYNTNYERGRRAIIGPKNEH